MYTQRITPFGSENIMTDTDRYMNQNNAAAAALQAQLAMHQQDLADRAAARAQASGQFDKEFGLQSAQQAFNQGDVAAGRNFQLQRDNAANDRALNLARIGNEVPAAELAFKRHNYDQEHQLDDYFQKLIMQGGNPSGQDVMNKVVGGQPDSSAPAGWHSVPGWKQSPQDAATEDYDNKLTQAGYTPLPVGIAPGAPGYPETGGPYERNTAPAGRGGPVDPMAAMKMYAMYKNLALFGQDERDVRKHQWETEDKQKESYRQSLTTAMQAAYAKGDVELGTKLAQQLAQVNDPGFKPDFGVIGNAYAPSPQQLEELSTKEAGTAAQGFNFQNTIANIQDLAKKAKWGEVDQNEVVDTANKLVQQLTQGPSHISEPQARQMIGEQLDKELAGFGDGTGIGNYLREIPNVISATAALPFAPTEEGTGRPMTYDNVGAAGALRRALAQQHFNLRQLSAPVKQQEPRK